MSDHKSAQSTIDSEVDQIFEKYGYFLGLAYEDENGNLATHKAGKVKQEILALFQAREQQLLSELLGAAVEVNTVQYSYVNGDKMIAGFTNSAVPVSVIERYREGLK